MAVRALLPSERGEGSYPCCVLLPSPGSRAARAAHACVRERLEVVALSGTCHRYRERRTCDEKMMPAGYMCSGVVQDGCAAWVGVSLALVGGPCATHSHHYGVTDTAFGIPTSSTPQAPARTWRYSVAKLGGRKFFQVPSGDQRCYGPAGLLLDVPHARAATLRLPGARLPGTQSEDWDDLQQALAARL